MITPRQCRAARGLLGYTQAELAQKAGLSKTGLNNFESGKSSMKASTQELLKKALEDGGIEFTKGEGVKLRTNETTMLYGNDALIQLWEHIFDKYSGYGGEVLIIQAHQNTPSNEVSNFLNARTNFINSQKIKQRVLLCEGDDYQFKSQALCKWIPKESFEYGNSKYIFGNYVAIKMLQDNMIVLINSAQAAEAERKQFNDMWANVSFSDEINIAS